jgi:hypothetical protein
LAAGPEWPLPFCPLFQRPRGFSIFLFPFLAKPSASICIHVCAIYMYTLRGGPLGVEGGGVHTKGRHLDEVVNGLVSQLINYRSS